MSNMMSMCRKVHKQTKIEKKWQCGKFKFSKLKFSKWTSTERTRWSHDSSYQKDENFPRLPMKTCKKSIDQLIAIIKHKWKYKQQWIINIKTACYIQANNYKRRNIMKTNEKLYRALVCRGPLQPQPANDQSQNEHKKVVFSYIRVTIRQRKTEYSGVLITVKNYISKN